MSNNTAGISSAKTGNINPGGDRMEKCRFKNDGRANPSLVIEHMKKEFERNIRHLTGESVELIVRKKQ